jgi:hypothetical protein
MLLDKLIYIISVINKRAWIPAAVTAIALQCAATNAMGASVTLAWDRNSEPNVSGYKVYYGPGNRRYPFVLDARNSNAQVINDLQDGVTYYFAVTAYDLDGQESSFSAEIPYTVPQRAISAVGDGSFRVRFQGVPERSYRVEYTESLTTPNWRTLGIHTAGANGLFEIIDRPIAGSPAGFYRSVYPAR